MCVNKPKGKIHIVLINVLLWHFQPNTLSRQKLLPVDITWISRGYHVFIETTWNNIKEGGSVRVGLEINKLSKNVDPYACAIREKNHFFKSWKTVGHIPKEICRHVYYVIKTEGGFVNGSIISTKYRPLPILCGGLEIPLLLKLSCPEQKRFEKKKNFVDSIYDYVYSGVNNEESSDEEEAAIVIETDQSKPVSRKAADQSKLQ